MYQGGWIPGDGPTSGVKAFLSSLEVAGRRGRFPILIGILGFNFNIASLLSHQHEGDNIILHPNTGIQIQNSITFVDILDYSPTIN